MTDRCPAQYPGRRRGDRYIDCHLPAGHPGEHEEADTEITWTSEPAAPQVTDDLRTLAAEAMRGNTVQTFQDAADAVLAAVLPVHRRQVLAEATNAVERLKPSSGRFWDTADAARVYTVNDATKALRSLAGTAPATSPGSTQPAQDARAVAEEAPNAAGPSEGAGGQRAPVNPYSDAISQHAFSLIFNGLTRAMTDAWWMPLSERMRASELIYETLRLGGVEIRLRDGLAELRAASEAIDKADG